MTRKASRGVLIASITLFSVYACSSQAPETEPKSTVQMEARLPYEEESLPMAPASPTSDPKGVEAWPERIRAHWSKPIYAIDPPLQLYGVYTYVVTGRSESDKEAFERFQALAEAAQSQGSHGDFSGSDRPDRLAINQFLIPCKSESVTVSSSVCASTQLDAELSKRILSWVLLVTEDDAAAERLGSNPGPFLISTVQPIGKYGSGELVDILYADLSLTAPGVMGEVVAAYKKKIQVHESGADRLKSLKVGVLSIVMNAVGYVNIFKGKLKASNANG